MLNYIKFSINYAKRSILLLKPGDWFIAVSIAVVTTGVGIYLKKKNYFKHYQSMALVLLVTYLFVVFSSTVGSRPDIGIRAYRIIPFWSYREIRKNGRIDLVVENLLNIALLMPVGALLPVLSKRLKLVQVIIVSGAISYGIELSQLFFRRGLFELVDDPFHNILGAVMGYFLFYGLRKTCTDRSA